MVNRMAILNMPFGGGDKATPKACVSCGAEGHTWDQCTAYPGGSFAGALCGSFGIPNLLGSGPAEIRERPVCAELHWGDRWCSPECQAAGHCIRIAKGNGHE